MNAPSDLGEASALVALVQFLDRATTPEDVLRARRLADSCGMKPKATVPPLPADVLARFTPVDIRAHLFAQFGDSVNDPGAAALCRHLVTVIAEPAFSPPDAVTTAEALAFLLRAAGPRRTRLQDYTVAAANLLADQARLSTDRLRRRLDGPDFPDLRTISLDVLRLEGVRWVLGILGHRPALAALSDHGRRLSRLTLKRAAATIQVFIDKPDMLALYDNVAVVSQVDNLLTVAGRLLDALQEQEEERTAFVAPEDETVLRAFGTALSGLAEMLGRIALKSVGRRDVSASVVVATLNQLRFLQEFAGRIGPNRPTEFDRLSDTLQRVARSLAARFEAVATGATESGPDGEGNSLAEQAQALSRLLAAMS